MKYFLVGLFLALAASLFLAPGSASAADTYRWADPETIRATVPGIATQSDLAGYGAQLGSTVEFKRGEGPHTSESARRYVAIINKSDSCRATLTLTVAADSKENGRIAATGCVIGGTLPATGKAITLSNAQAAADDPVNPAPTDGEEGAAEEEITCETSPDVTPALRFVACPALEATTSSMWLLDDLVGNMLNYDIRKLEDSAAQDAWRSFQIIAYSLVFIAGLVIVIGQAAGVQFLDAYTIKKALPRLIIAVIFIALSWEILLLFVAFMNQLGWWAQDLIMEPFNENLKDMNAENIWVGGALNAGVAAGAATGLVGVLVYMGTIGWAGVGLLLLSWLIGLLIIFAVVAIRTILITLGIVLAPLAIASMILPATQNLWELWRKAFITASTVFPLIMALLAMGKVAGQIMGWPLLPLLYIAPYFLIPAVFKLAGGLIGRIAGMVNDPSRGVFDRMRNARGEIYGRNKQEAIEGRTALGRSPVGSFHRRASLMRQGAFVPTKAGQARYKQAVAGMMAMSTAKTLDDSGNRVGDDDALDIASDVSTTRSNFLTRYSQQYKQKAYKAELDAATAEGRASRYASANDVDDKEAANAALTARAQLETAFNSQVGTDHMRATAARGWFASATAADTRTVEGDISKVRQKAVGLIQGGVLNRDDVIASIKGNRSRADISGAGFGDWIPALDAEVQKVQRTGQIDTTINATDRALAQQAINGARAGDIAMGNKRAVINYGRAMTARLNGGQQNEAQFMADLAAVAGMYDAMSQANPTNARELQKELTSQTITFTDTKGAAQKAHVAQIIEANRGNEEFLKLRREYGSRLQADMNNRPVQPEEEH